MLDERYRSIAQTLSGAMNTAVTVYSNGEREFSVPDEVSTVESITLRKDFYKGLDLSGESSVLYLTNKYSENYIVVRSADKIDIILGPYCTTRMTGLSVTAVIRETGLPSRCRSKLLEHFMALPVFSVSQNYYIGQLMLALLTRDVNPAVPELGMMKSFPSTEFTNRRIQNRVSQYIHPPYFLEQELERAIIAGDKSSAFAVLNEYSAVEGPRLAEDDLRSIKNLNICSCAVFARAAVKGGVGYEDASNLCDIFINKMESSSTVEEVAILRDEMADSFIDMVRSVRMQSYSAPINETIQYINAHLTDKLTLPELAELVHLHPNYLSSVFKRETGESVTTYILRQRVYEAAHMLQTTDRSASDISSFYLFCNQSYFIKTFRRFMGCSPQQYREQCRDMNR